MCAVSESKSSFSFECEHKQAKPLGVDSLLSPVLHAADDAVVPLEVLHQAEVVGHLGVPQVGAGLVRAVAIPAIWHQDDVETCSMETLIGCRVCPAYA